jgi:hypothetical protein
MRTIVATLVCLLAGSFAAPAFGHPEGHDEPSYVTPLTAKSLSDQVVKQMVERKIVPESWLKAAAKSPDVRVRNGEPEYVTVYRNAAIADPAKQTLYVIFSVYGQYLGASHTDH